MNHLHQSAAVRLHRQMYMMSLRQNDWNFLLTTIQIEYTAPYGHTTAAD